jgi:hypothetical protein
MILIFGTIILGCWLYTAIMRFVCRVIDSYDKLAAEEQRLYYWRLQLAYEAEEKRRRDAVPCYNEFVKDHWDNFNNRRERQAKENQ